MPFLSEIRAKDKSSRGRGMLRETIGLLLINSRFFSTIVLFIHLGLSLRYLR